MRYSEARTGRVFVIRLETGDRLPDAVERLAGACTGHTHGQTVAEITVATCRDADRLDLARVGKIPRPERLCTEAAGDPVIIAWACSRSLSRGWSATPWPVPSHPPQPWRIEITMFGSRSNPRPKENDHVATPRT